jgi:hypothetical protein
MKTVLGRAGVMLQAGVFVEELMLARFERRCRKEHPGSGVPDARMPSVPFT